MEYRTALLTDLDELNSLEYRVFSNDQITMRQMKRFIQSSQSFLLLASDQGVIAGYALLLFNKGTQLARLYSLALLPQYRGLGIAGKLVSQCEKHAVDNGYITLRLEVREDNFSAQKLYESLGYKYLKTLVHYYDDLADGVRMQKRLDAPGPSRTLEMPLYIQTTPFTCGAACLLMSFAALDHSTPPSRRKEIQLWREATTVFMAGGHGGCSGHGLALAAYRRGFDVELWSHAEDDIPFIHSVRDPLKKSVIRLVHEDFASQIEEAGITVHSAPPTVAQLESWINEGACVLLLISTYRFNGCKEPHWIVLSGMNELFFFFHDPLVESPGDAVNSAFVPVSKASLNQIVGFGKQKHTSCVAIYPKRESNRLQAQE